jgi:peptide-methionine (S)-S-oxide reductase
MTLQKREIKAAVLAMLIAVGLCVHGNRAHAAEPQDLVVAGGCFWCVEADFEKVSGVIGAVSGFTGGTSKNPSYKEVTQGTTGHFEAVKITFDPDKVTRASLLDLFFRSVDPTDAGGQFCDRGDSYRSGIFPLDAEQERLARASRQALKDDPEAPSPVVTEITRADRFWPAEQYHQNYYRKNPLRYRFYKSACGRADRLEQLWGEG